jgi:hypothetical protein
MNNLISNPLFLRAQEMAKGKSEMELQQIAMNICREKGLDMNQAYENFKEQFKGLIPFK